MSATRTSSWLVMIALSVACIVLVAGPAAAHLDLVSTTPSDGAVQTKTVKQVKLKFSKAGKPARSGIQMMNEGGGQVPVKVTSSDAGLTWVVTPSEPLGDGDYGVKWSVAAPDAHPKTGAFRFTVELPGATTTESNSGADAGADPVGKADSLDTLLAEPVASRRVV